MDPIVNPISEPMISSDQPSKGTLASVVPLTRMDGNNQLERSNAPRTNAAKRKRRDPAVMTDARASTECSS
jgi:hypothetical protein